MYKKNIKSKIKFIDIYKREPDDIAFTPYRICPLGAHVDHQYGKVTGFAIDKGIYLSYSIKHNGIIELMSLQFDKRAQWTVFDVPSRKQNDWADHLRGATIALKKRYPLFYGLCGVIDGELPIGGLSSSAAVIITFLQALCKINNINLSNEELIDIAQEAENKYVGVSCGKLDQSCEVYCKKDKLLYLDTMDGSYSLIESKRNMPPYEFVIFFSGLERTLSGSKYNMRADECKSAAYALLAYSGIEYGKFEDTRLRDVSKEIYSKYKDKLPVNWAKRAEHYYSEQDRVEKGINYWRDGDIANFGKLMFESCESSINNYEVGSEQLTTLYRIIAKQDGVYGSRFSGAGFKGCCIAVINPAHEKEIFKSVEDEYLSKFPELKGKFNIFVCKTSNGVAK